MANVVWVGRLRPAGYTCPHPRCLALPRWLGVWVGRCPVSPLGCVCGGCQASIVPACAGLVDRPCGPARTGRRAKCARVCQSHCDRDVPRWHAIGRITIVRAYPNIRSMPYAAGSGTWTGAVGDRLGGVWTVTRRTETHGTGWRGPRRGTPGSRRLRGEGERG